MPLFRDENGLVFEADDVFAHTMGYEPVSPAEEHEMLKAEAMQERADERGTLGTVNAGLTGLASGLTLGASDVALGGLMTDEERATLQSDLATHPYARAGGEIAGAVAGSFAAPGSGLAKTPAGYFGAAASQAVESNLARGGLVGTAKALGTMGAEGALQNAGQYIGYSALADKDVTAEGLSGALGTGFAFGAGGGGVALGVTKGTIAARRLYARVMGGEQAVQAAESAWTKTQQELFEADNITADLARKRLDDINAAKLEALRYVNESKAAVQEAKIRAASAPRAKVPDFEAGILTNVREAPFDPNAPLDIKPATTGEPTQVRQRIEFDPVDAHRFEKDLPMVGDEEIVPADLMAKPNSGQQTSVFKREPTEVIPPSKKLAAKKGALPQSADEVVDETIATVSAKDIEAHGWESLSVPGKDKVKLDKARKAIAEGQRDPIKIAVSPGGKYVIEDGTNRLAAAIEAGKPVKVQWYKGSKGLDEAAEGATDLEKQLAGTKQQLDAGKGINEIKGQHLTTGGEKKGRPLAKGIADMFDELDEFSQVRKVEDIRGAANAKGEAARQLGPRKMSELRYDKTAELLGPAIAKEEERLISALEARDVARSQIEKYATPDGIESAADSIPVRDTEGFPPTREGRADLQGDNYDGPIPVIDTEGFPPTGELGRGPSNTKVGKRPKQSIEALDRAHEDALRMAAEATDPYTRGQAIKAADDLEQILAKLSPREDLVSDVNKAHHVFGAYDNAMRDLVDAVGDGAHPSLQEYVKAVDKAHDETMGKAFDRAARAVEDADHFGTTPKQSVLEARQRKLEATREYDRLTVEQKQAQADFNAARVKVRAGEKAKKAALKLDAKAARDAGRMNKATLFGGFAELADIPGLPKPSDLPVVGPFLGAWLKWKTLKAAMGRAAGRIPATADSRVAALAARTQDRVARAVDRSLGLVEKAGRVATKAAPPAAGILSRRIFNDGQPDAKKNAPLTEVAAVRMRELQAYVSTPMAIELDVRRELRDVADPDVIAAAEKHRRAMFEYLASTMPKLPENGLLEKTKWQPHPLQALEFARRMEAASDPGGVLERLADTRNMINLEAAETLRNVYPQLFMLAQQRLMQRASEMQTSVPYNRRVALSLVYQLPLDSSLQPDRLVMTQSVFEKKITPAPVSPDQPAAPPTPSVAQPTNIAASYVRPGDRREFQQR